jgi:hypothetical protein
MKRILAADGSSVLVFRLLKRHFAEEMPSKRP